MISELFFTFPEFLFLWVIVIGYMFFRFRRGDMAYQVPNRILLSFLKHSKLFILSEVFLFLLLLLGIIFFAWPKWHFDAIELTRSPRDITIVLDISKSMLAEDIAPNRIRKAKEILDTFITKLDHNRIGLIIFAGKPFIISPPTFDTIGIRSLLDQIRPETIDQNIPGLSGTAIGDALLLANTFYTGSTSRDGAIILLTDGTYNIGIDPKIAVEETRALGTQLFVVGIGNPEGIDLYTTDTHGEKKYFLDIDGKQIKATLDEPLMQTLASKTRGQYFLAQDTVSFARIFWDIASLTSSRDALSHLTDTLDLRSMLAGSIIFLSIFQMLTSLYYRKRYKLL